MAIADIDTRRLTRILREKGAQSGCIMAGAVDDEAKALEAAHAFPGLAGMDLAKVVSAHGAYEWTETEWTLGTRLRPSDRAAFPRGGATTTASSATSCACSPSAAAR